MFWPSAKDLDSCLWMGRMMGHSSGRMNRITPVLHDGPPQALAHPAAAVLVGVGDAVDHEPEGHGRRAVVSAGALMKFAWFHVALALPGAQEDVAPATPLQHALGDEIVLVLVAVAGQVGPVGVPLEVGLDLIGYVDQIGVDGQVVGAVVCTGWADALGLGLDGFMMRTASGTQRKDGFQ